MFLYRRSAAKSFNIISKLLVFLSPSMILSISTMPKNVPSYEEPDRIWSRGKDREEILIMINTYVENDD